MNFWDGIYRVEEDGKVFRLAGKGRLFEREKKPCINKKGYLALNLSINSKPKKMLVHRLIALTYIPNPENKPHIDHIDRNTLNNHISNLRWVTQLENNQNKKIGKSGERYIVVKKCGAFQIQFQRNKLLYRKCIPKTSTMQHAIIQRDLMLSMF